MVAESAIIADRAAAGRDDGGGADTNLSIWGPMYYAHLPLALVDPVRALPCRSGVQQQDTSDPTMERMRHERQPTEQSDWQRYRETGDVEVRNRLAERHIPLVHHFARRVSGHGGVELDVDDLVSAGVLGLLSAVMAFDPNRGYRFSTFAATRIRGAMLDELRRRDVAPRSVRRRQRAMERAADRLAVELDRSPSHPEIARVLAVDEQTLWRWKWDVKRSERPSMTVAVAGGSPGEGMEVVPTDRLDGMGQEGLEAVEDRLTREAEVRRLRRELGALPERERLVIELYDIGSLTLRQIAVRLGVTESRVSQIRTRALGRLRARMQDLREAA
jgi:RNA polymerase sigma factor FliA